MFDSVDGFYAPVCGLVLILAWFISGLRPWSLKILLALVGPVLISFAWSYLPWFSLWFRPLPFGQEDWRPWAFIATASRSLIAVPLSLIVVLALSYWRKTRGSEI